MLKPVIRVIGVVVMALAHAPGALTSTQSPAPAAGRGPDFNGRLYRAVFVPGPDTLSSGNLADAPQPVRDRLSRFLVRRAAFTSLYKGSATDIESVARDAKRRALERAIVALIESDGVAQRAVDFVAAAPIANEWKGAADAPLAEAAFAEQFLQKEPSTPLAPFLHLFIAQRQRAASELAGLNQDGIAAQAAAAKAREYLRKARGASDPIFGLIADDLERLPEVHVKKKAGAEARDQ
jgi:hypothetical protein